MSEAPNQVRPRSIKEARAHSQRRRAENASETNLSLSQPTLKDSNVSGYFFKLQGEVEKTGSMDYHVYAERMWSELFGSKDEDSIGRRQFTKNMITGLHNIDMKDLVRQDLLVSMPELLTMYGDVVKGVALWSTGDVTATGYQLGKIESSKFIQRFFNTIRQALPRTEGRDFIKDKTSYLVDDDKFDRLREYARQVLEKGGSVPVKVVIIEDAVGNFEKAKKILDEQFGKERVEIIPIWFTDSRAGIKAKEAGSFDTVVQQQREQFKDFTTISSFNELKNKEKFGSIFQDAYVMVDFDGVISDNVRMRDLQADIIYKSLIQGVVEERKCNIETATKLVLDSFTHFHSNSGKV